MGSNSPEYDAADATIGPVSFEDALVYVIYDGSDLPPWWRPIKRWKAKKNQIITWGRFD